MGHSHGHDHGSTSPQADRGTRRRLLIAFCITAIIVVAQAVGSVVTGSLALLTDTAHALADASGLLVAVIAATMMLRPPSSKRTWGFARIEVIAALGAWVSNGSKRAESTAECVRALRSGRRHWRPGIRFAKPR